MPRFTDRFTGGKLPPHGIPSDVLAWIEFGYGSMYLTRQFKWVDDSDPDAAKIIDSLIGYLSPGPSLGSLLAYHCNFVSAYYNHEYPIYQRIIEDLGGDEVIY